MQRPEEYWCQTQAQDPGPPPTLSHQHLASAPFVRNRVVGASGRPGPRVPVEEVPCCPSVPRRFRRPQPQLGNSETKVSASNCLLSKAQPASSATGVRGKLMSWLGERGGAALLEACATLANGLVTLGRWPRSPSFPICPAVISPVLQRLLSPQPWTVWGFLGPAWAQTQDAGCALSLAGPPTPCLYNRSLGRSRFECPSCSNRPRWDISGGGSLRGRVSPLRYY